MVPSHHNFHACSSSPSPTPSLSSGAAVSLLSQNISMQQLLSRALQLFLWLLPNLFSLPQLASHCPNYALGISPSICICIFSDLLPFLQVSASQTCPWSILETEWEGNRLLTIALGHHGTHPLSHRCSFSFLLTFMLAAKTSKKRTFLSSNS